jgi:hypothetical protein
LARPLSHRQPRTSILAEGQFTGDDAVETIRLVWQVQCPWPISVSLCITQTSGL